MSDHDLFLSYHSADREAVLGLRRFLESRGIATFLDREHLVPGMPWPQALEQALNSVKSVAVFIGPKGLGMWQKREMWVALDRQAREEGRGGAFPVVPVLLPGADPVTGFLFLNTWVDLRRNLADPAALEALVRTATGMEPAAAPDQAAATCPYRGLHPFLEEHASLFYGREAFAARLLEEVAGHDLVAVIGPSGSGKSSVVHAGLLPLLRRRRPPEGSWDAVSFRPGASPFHNLARAFLPLLEPELGEGDRLAEATRLGQRLAAGEVLAEDLVERLLTRSGGSDRLLLVADQFEELFTQTPAALREPFADALLQALERSPLTLIPTLRADFYGRAIGLSRALSDRLERSLVNLGPMRREELERAIVEPARRVALTFEAGLVGRILEDVGQEPGNLPLLEFALAELWARRSGGRLLHAAYEAIGEVSGAIAKRADAEFSRLSDAEKAQAQRVFTHLVRVAPPGEWSEDTRRRATLAELGEAAAPVVEELAHARLLVASGEEESTAEAAGEEGVELAHEALIRHWQRLRGWLDSDREFLLWQQRLGFALAQFERTGGDSGTLLRGAPLAEAERWLEERGGELSEAQRSFIQAGSAARERESAERERRRRHRVFGLVAGLLVALLLAVVAGLGWLEARREAAARAAAETRALAERDAAVLARRSSTSRELAARAVNRLEVDPELALLLALEAVQTDVTAEAGDALRRALQASRVRVRLAGHGDLVKRAVFGPAGGQVATASYDGTVRLWNAATGAVEGVLEGHGGAVLDVAFSPDGTRLASGGHDRTVRLWDRRTARPLAVLSGHTDEVRSVAFNADGTLLASGGPDRNVRIWDLETEEEAAVLRDQATVQSARFSHDGRYLLTAGGNTARVWELAGKSIVATLRGHRYNVYEAAFSRDGKWVITAGEDRTARLWAWRTNAGKPLRTLRHTSSVHSVAFSPDGRWIATGTRAPDNAVHLWEAASGEAEIVLRGHTEAVDSVAFDPDGRRILTGSQDHGARIWARDLTLVRGPGRELEDVAFSPDGKRIVTASRDHRARIWAADTGALLLALEGHGSAVTAAGFDPGGGRVVTASVDNTARIWNGETGMPLHVLRGHASYVTDAAFSHDGTRVVTASEDRTARIWNADSGALVTVLRGHRDRLKGAAFSPDGRRVVTASLDGTARIWNADGGGTPVELRGHGRGVNDARFSPDGRRVVTAGLDRTARIWDAASGTCLQVLEGHTDAVWSAAFSPDGRWVLTAGDRTARVWDAAGGGPVAVFHGHSGRVMGAAFAPDGGRIATASWDGTARLFPCHVCRPVEALAKLARRRVTRQLTPEERAVYLR